VTLTVEVTGAGTVGVSPLPTMPEARIQSGQTYQYPTGTVVTLTANPDAGQLLARWIVDGATQPPYGNGWANPLTVTLNGSHTVAATFATRPSFSDLPAGTVGDQAASELAARGIVKGYDQAGCAARGVAFPCYGPTDSTERAQAAAFLSRLLGLDGEDHGNGGFTDLDGLSPDLQRAVGTMAFHGIMVGYGGGRFGPFDRITHAETALVISRAMVFKGYWTRATVDVPAIYPNLDLGPQARLDLVTFVQNAGNLPGFANDIPRWPLDLPTVRVWTAQALWQALDSYFGVDQPGKGGFVP